MFIRFVFMGVFLSGLSSAQTSADNARLKAALERHPEADADQDGVLTMEEAVEFRDKHVKARGKGAGMVPEGGERHVYKMVGGTELPLYVYAPANHPPDAKSPAVVFFFGGGWTTGNPDQFEPQC